MILWVAVVLLLLPAGFLNAGDKPSLDVKWYGYIKLDGAYDNNLTSHGNYIMWIQPRVYGKDDEQLNITANETRLGINISSTGYQNAEVGGKLECDFYGSVSGGTVSENKPLLMLRHAYLTLKFGHTTILAGQSWDLIAPLNPSTLNYSVLWGCGNIGYRRPQLSLWQTLTPGTNTSVTFAAGVFRNIGNDLTPSFSLEAGEVSEGADDGTDAGIPSIQGRWELKYDFGSGGVLRFGTSGLWGQLKAETSLGHSNTYKSWASAGHLLISFPSGFGLSGEIYTGSNLGSYFGAILRNSEIKGIRSMGGWVSVWMKLSSKVQLAEGFGMDDPEDKDFSSGRSKNTCAFANIRYSVVPNATIGLELSNWQTDYKNAKNVKDFRTQTSFILNF